MPSGGVFEAADRFGRSVGDQPVGQVDRALFGRERRDVLVSAAAPLEVGACVRAQEIAETITEIAVTRAGREINVGNRKSGITAPSVSREQAGARYHSSRVEYLAESRSGT